MDTSKEISERENQTASPPEQSCLSCRVVGASVCTACSAYLAGTMYLGHAKSKGHKYGLAAGAVLFGALAVARAVS